MTSLRSGSIGELETKPSEFRWRAVAGAASYRVELRDVAGDLVASAESRAPRLALEGELARRLESRVTYSWTVTARDAAGIEVARSAAAVFRYR